MLRLNGETPQSLLGELGLEPEGAAGVAPQGDNLTRSCQGLASWDSERPCGTAWASRVQRHRAVCQTTQSLGFCICQMWVPTSASRNRCGGAPSDDGYTQSPQPRVRQAAEPVGGHHCFPRAITVSRSPVWVT